MDFFISIPFLVGILLFILSGVYVFLYIFFSSRVKNEEKRIIDIFLKKVSKIPALVEVMRPYIVKDEAFAPIITLHTEIMVESIESIYDILASNAQIQNEFLFLMKLSIEAPELQKHEYFLYIRNFILEYERSMRTGLGEINSALDSWNRFVKIKNMTIFGYFLPGTKRAVI